MAKLYFFSSVDFVLLAFVSVTEEGVQIDGADTAETREMFFMAMYICQIRHKGGRIRKNLKV